MTFSIVNVVAPAEVNVTPSATPARADNKYPRRMSLPRIAVFAMPRMRMARRAELQNAYKKITKIFSNHRGLPQDGSLNRGRVAGRLIAARTADV
jgi:hypothetical protein